MKKKYRLLFLLSSVLAHAFATAQTPSELWGKNGEKWTPQSRLPDFSYAGYHFGEDPIPVVGAVANVRDFGAVGDVIKNGRGTYHSLDHHRKAPYENLFCNLDVGTGTDMWRCGGSASLGKRCAARGTFWCIRSDTDQIWPRENFGPDSMILVGVQTREATQVDPDGRWFEAIPPEELSTGRSSCRATRAPVGQIGPERE